jgi:hypothetical protein
MAYQKRLEQRCEPVHTFGWKFETMGSFTTDKPWLVWTGIITTVLVIAGMFGSIIQHDQAKTDAITSLTEKMGQYQSNVASWQSDITMQLRDIQTRLSAGAVYPVQIQDMDRRATAMEHTQDSVSTRLQAIDAELIYLRNQSDNSKAAFADIWPRLQQLERKRNER